MYGWAGQRLRIDLTTGEIKKEPLSYEYRRKWLGGRGFNSEVIYREVPPDMDPFDPRARVCFGVGPISGTAAPSTGRVTVSCKSPLTGGFGDSNMGGHWGAELKYAGYDQIVIQGKAKKPVYIWIDDDKVEIRDASHLWGKDCYETEEILRKDEGGEVLSIGQAGENLVRFACITHRKGRQFGRCGAGAVMGSKKLKAIVIQGSREVEVAKPDELKEFRKWLNENVVKNLEAMRRYGTPNMVDVVNKAGVFPTKYWEKGSFEYAKMINAEALKKYVKRSSACYACTVSCGKISKINDIEVEGPEYETIFAFGSLCYNSDIESIIKANDLCDRYGMDTISAGNVIAYYMACCEKNGIGSIKFGDSEAILDLLKKIAFRDGIGNVLAEGVARASKVLKASVEPVHVRGLELPGYDPRGLYGMALSYVTSQRGACHMRSCAYRPNLTGVVDRFLAEGQASLVKELEDFYCVVDSLVFCKFLCLPVIGMSWNEIAKLYEIVTGKKITVEDLKRAGERIHNLTREFNIREGVEKAELPKVFFKPNDRGFVLRKEDYEFMVKEYYEKRNR